MLSSALAAAAGGMTAEATGATAAGAGASADLLATNCATGVTATGTGATTEAGVDGATSAEANGFWYSESAFSTCTAEGW
jgi:hypothetical protein